MDALAHQIPGKDPANDSRFIWVDLRQAVRPFTIAEEAGIVVIDFAILEVFPMAPLDAGSEGLTLRLGLTHHKGENHFIVHI